jgi:hypothetical protein
MLAPRRVEVARLNELARASLLEMGRVGGEELAVGRRGFARGDRVVLRRNAPRLGVENGTRGEITHVDTDAHVLTLRLADGGTRRLPSTYLQVPTDRGGAAVEHGYALTAHLAQGMTTDRVFVLGSETVYREWGYVAWSRARHGARFYAVEPEVSEEHHNVAPPSVDGVGEITRRLDRSEAQELALDSAPEGRRVAAAKHGRLLYLEEALGSQPDALRARRRWDRAARRLERYRARHSIEDQRNALGPEPAARVANLSWRMARRELERSQRQLGITVANHRDGRGIAL